MLVARLEVLGEVDARGGIRFTVDSDATIRGMDGEPIDVIVDNFSRTGFLFTADTALPLGTLVSIGLSGAGTREAKVVRRDGQSHGCEFLMPLLRREMATAFRGQEHVVADLEAALGRRFAEPADAAPEPEPEPPESPSRRSVLAAMRRLLRR